MRGLVVALALLAACGDSGPPPGAVLVVDEVKETQCGKSTCVSGVVTNQGPEAGSGRCTLNGVGHDYRGNGIKGPRFDVPKLDPHASWRFVKAIELTKKERGRLLQWSSSCSPGPGL